MTANGIREGSTSLKFSTNDIHMRLLGGMLYAKQTTVVQWLLGNRGLQVSEDGLSQNPANLTKGRPSESHTRQY